jgi:hypothetical protein
MTLHRVTCLAIGLVFLLAVPVFSKTFYVPGDASTIQGCIDLAEDTDTVLVFPGTYAENIFMYDQNISIVSADGPEVTILQPADPNAPLIAVYTTTASAYSPVISGFTITGTGDSDCITLDGEPNVTISGNIFHNNIPDKVYDKAVIHCAGDSSRPVISHNIFYDNYGLCCITIPDGMAQIIGNTFVDNRVAMLSSSDQCEAVNNIISGCLNLGMNGTFGYSDYNLFWANILDYG